jgi:hypothetical protein
MHIDNPHEHVRGERYAACIDAHVEVFTRLFPSALLQWEDFAPGNGRRMQREWSESTLPISVYRCRTRCGSRSITGARQPEKVRNGARLFRGDCSFLVMLALRKWPFSTHYRGELYSLMTLSGLGKGVGSIHLSWEFLGVGAREICHERDF